MLLSLTSLGNLAAAVAAVAAAATAAIGKATAIQSVCGGFLECISYLD